MIRLRDVHRSYGDRRVLCGVDLEVAEGEFVSVVGRSGSGKTTLLNVVGGLDGGYRGRVVVAGRDLSGLSDRELSAVRNSLVGFVFQAYHLLEHLSCRDNVALPALFARGRQRVGWSESNRRADEVLELVGLGDRGDEPPSQLSGGERQRVALARALFSRPRVLICDEVTGNLDSGTGAEILALLARIHRQSGVTVLAATHDEAITRTGDRVARLCEGVLRWNGGVGGEGA